MPALDAQNAVVSAILEVKALLDELLVESETIKPTDISGNASSNIEPPLKKADFNNVPGRVADASSGGAAHPTADNDDSGKEDFKGRQFSVVEIAARDIFGELVVSFPSRVSTPILAIASDSNRDGFVVFHIDRQSRLRQDLEPPRYSLNSLRRRPMRSRAAVLARRGADRQPDDCRLPYRL